MSIQSILHNPPTTDTAWWRRSWWEAAVFSLNVALLVALALGVRLPATGVVSLTLAYLAVFVLPGLLLYRLLLPAAAFDLPSRLLIAVALGVGALSVPVLLINLLPALHFSAVLLVHAGWQAAALAARVYARVRQRRPSEPPPAEVGDAPTGTHHRSGLIALVYAVVVVAAVGAVIVALAASDLHDGVSLGGSDKNAYTNIVNWLYHHPTEPYQSNARGHNIAFRLATNAWVYEQALIAWVSGLTPLEVIETHPTGPLLVLAFLGFYALGYAVTRQRKVALLALPLSLMVACVEATHPVGVLGWGDRLLDRIVEDKIVNAYVFVPAALVLTFYLLDRAPPAKGWQRLRPWGALLMVFVAMIGAHPLGFGLYVMIVSSCLLVRLLANPTCRALLVAGGVGAALLAVAGLPVAQLIASRRALDIFDWAATPLRPGLMRVGWEGAYILHPDYISSPVHLAGIALALLMVTRARHDRAAQYLFAATAMPLFLTYTPYVASTLGNIIKPDMLERLIWLLPIGLSMAYALWLLLAWLGARVTGRALLALSLAPLALALLLLAPAYRAMSTALFDRSLRPALPEYVSPEIETLAEALGPLTSRDAPVLAPPEVNTYLFITLPDTYVYHFRAGFVELRDLYANPWWGEDARALFEDFAPAYFVAENGSHAQTFARLQPDRFTPLYQNARYTLYEAPAPWPPTAADHANTLVAQLSGTLVTPLMDAPPPDGTTWADAVAEYERALRADPADYRALYGLAYALAQSGDLIRAEARYREVLATFPDDGNVRTRLAETLHAQSRTDEALDALLERLDPATLRAVLDEPYLGALSEAQLAAALDAWEAAPAFVSGPHAGRALADRLLSVRGDRAGAMRALVHIPPDYRTPGDLERLGTLYMLAGDHERALAAFDAGAGRSAVSAGLASLLRGHLAMGEDPSAARRAYEAAAGAYPIPAAWVFVGQAAAAGGDLRAAEDAYRRAASLDLPADYWARVERASAEGSDPPEAPASIAGNFWGEAALLRLYDAQGRTDEADAAYARAVAILDIAGIPPFPRAYPPSVISPLAPGLAGPRADIGVPGGTTLASFAVLSRTLGPPVAQPEGPPTVYVTLDWLGADQGEGAALWQIKAVTPDPPTVLGEHTQAALTPAGGMARWTFALPVRAPADAGPAPAEVQVVAVLPEHPAGALTYRAGAVMLSAPPPPQTAPAVALALDFGGQVELYGYTLPGGPFRPGEALEVTLYWRALAPPPVDLVAFVHLLDAAGDYVTQVDAPLGPYPTSLWEAGAQVAGAFPLSLPDDLAAGRYRLVAGVYATGTFERLAVAGAPDGAPDGVVHLGDIDVAAQQGVER